MLTRELQAVSKKQSWLFELLSPPCRCRSCAFMGGTDVDKPLKLSLDRLSQEEWAQVGSQVVQCWSMVLRHWGA